MSRQAEVDAAVADVDFEKKSYQARVETSAGEFYLDFLPDVAPMHCKNMIGLARIGYYDGLIFHRIIKGFMIQGGCPDGTGAGNPGYKIDAEFNSTPHVAGVVSMARTQAPNSAGSQFFVCLGAHTHLDGQYTAFGRATEESMEVIEKIGQVEINPGDRPKEDVVINKITIIES